MNLYYEKLLHCVDFIRQRTEMVPRVGLVLGSGFSEFAAKLKIECIMDYATIPGFPTSSVPGHPGKFVFGYLKNVPMVIMQGRVHYYEGYDMVDVVLPIRLMRLLGIESLVLTNAAGGINPAFSPGDFMVITDHISSFVPSPLRGENINEIGPRFPDMSCVYSAELNEKFKMVAKKLGLSLRTGVYLQTSGPQYETPHEIKMFQSLGADAVGMSTACEAVAAAHMGLKICAISCITNMAAGISANLLSHEEVTCCARNVQESFFRLLYEFIALI